MVNGDGNEVGWAFLLITLFNYPAYSTNSYPQYIHIGGWLARGKINVYSFKLANILIPFNSCCAKVYCGLYDSS